MDTTIKRADLLPREIKDFLVDNGLNCEWRTGEHDGCWDKGCSHPVNELNIWRGDERRFSMTFEEGCRVSQVLHHLTDRVHTLPQQK